MEMMIQRQYSSPISFEPKLVGMCLELSFGIPTGLPQQDIGPMGKMKKYFFSDTRY
jgi:hypothetical protein